MYLMKTDRAIKKFARALRETRRGQNLTQQSLAADMGVEPGYLSLLENGRKNVSLATVIKCAEALGLEVMFGPYKLSR